MKSILMVALLGLTLKGMDANCSDGATNCDRFRRFCRTSSAIRAYCPQTCNICAVPTPKPQPPPPLPPSKVPPKKNLKCGKPDIKGQRVIGGITAARGSWPWQILLMYGSRGVCGGSIVGPRHVVTAAHCISRAKQYPSRFKVRVGEHRTDKREGTEVDYQVKKIYQHPEYNRPSPLNNDIAVLELVKPILFGKYVQPVCLPDKSVKVGSECYITGWGKVRHPGDMTNVLQQVKMPVVSNGVCHKKNFPRIRVPVTNRMICSGDGGTTQKSGCHGDSGGPFVCQVNGRWELHGAVSHGSPRCKSTETYTVYARVAYFKKWIDNIMSN